jgi:hypothetical protein
VKLAPHELTVTDFDDSGAVIDGEIIADGEVLSGLMGRARRICLPWETLYSNIVPELE